MLGRTKLSYILTKVCPVRYLLVHPSTDRQAILYVSTRWLTWDSSRLGATLGSLTTQPHLKYVLPVDDAFYATPLS